jgi:hypothetical protein
MQFDQRGPGGHDHLDGLLAAYVQSFGFDALSGEVAVPTGAGCEVTEASSLRALVRARR